MSSRIITVFAIAGRNLERAWPRKLFALRATDGGLVHQDGDRDGEAGDSPAGATRTATPTASWRTRVLTKLGTAGVTLAMFVQVIGLCLCVTRAPASTDSHSCCPRPPSSESSDPGPISSLTDHARDCCSEGLHVRADVRLNEREPSHAPATYVVSSTASFRALADGATPFGGTASARARASSPPRSSVLRI